MGRKQTDTDADDMVSLGSGQGSVASSSSSIRSAGSSGSSGAVAVQSLNDGGGGTALGASSGKARSTSPPRDGMHGASSKGGSKGSSKGKGEASRFVLKAARL